MKKIGICLLGYGDEHIKECNYLIDKLSKFKSYINIYIGTDSVEKISKNVDKIINITETFNYNLKRVSVREALKDCDIIILMDSDIFFRNINFSYLNNIEDGIYSYFIRKEYERDYINNEYQKILYNYNDKNALYCIYEYFVILKISDEHKKNDFIYNWDTLYEMTKNVQPIDLAGVHYGAQEGLILYVSGVKSGINCFDAIETGHINSFISLFHHHYHHYEKNIKHEITLI